MSDIQNVGADRLNRYFLKHLDLIYGAKLQLIKTLPEIAAHASFADLKSVLLETCEDIRGQVLRMDQIYIVLDGTHGEQADGTMTGLIADTLQSVYKQSDDEVMRDLSILYYMQNIESIEVASFKTLQLAAVKMKNKQVIRLLQENFDEAVEDKALLLLINAKYLLG